MKSAPAVPRGAGRRLVDEEWLPVILGAAVIILVLVGLRVPLPSFKWQTPAEFSAAAARSEGSLASLVRDAEAAGQTSIADASRALEDAVRARDRAACGKAAGALAAAARAAGDQAGDLGKTAAAIARSLGDAAGQRIAKVFSGPNLLWSLAIGLAFMVLAAIGVVLGGGRIGPFLAGFPVVYVIAWLAQLIAGNLTVNYLGFEYVIFALAIGLIISNVLGVPDWLREAVRTEYYIKTGLVVMGATILFPEILQAGLLGIIQALCVVFVVWYACYLVSRKLGVDREFSTILSSAVSICGVSAAIAASGAINGDKKKLSYVISLTLICAVPMMVAMPWLARLLGLGDATAGAWMGGTLDTTGSVVAATSLVGDRAVRIGTIVKFSQNVLIGVAAFVLSVWWAATNRGPKGERPRVGVIWDRFPKFVLGFLAASLVFSFLLSPGLVKETKSFLSGLRNIWFALAFVSIGLETRFTGLLGMGKGRPALAFVIAQAFNVLWTLLLAWLLFGGKILPLPAFK